MNKVHDAMAEVKPEPKSEDDDFDFWLDKKTQNSKPFRHENGMTFTIYPARGGFVVEYSQYNDKSSDTDHGLHIITGDQDLGDALGKIITIQQLIK